MLFFDLANLFEKLEKNSKRIEKILILRDLYFNYKSETPKVFDLISNNFYRSLKKTNIGISLKTIFSVLEFLSSKSSNDINSEFSKIGDVGILCMNILKEKKQENFSKNKLEFKDIILSIEKISNISGKNSNKIKIEIISKLFLNCSSDIEVKHLAKILVGDFRIGVLVGTLIESVLNIFIPKIFEIHFICDKCNYINLNNNKCLNCENLIDKKNQIKFIQNKKVLEEDKIDYEKLLFEEDFIVYKNPRELYNFYFKSLEEKYNCINSFEKLFSDIEKDKKNLLKVQTHYFTPIKSMLGTRLKDFSQVEKEVKYPIFADFKYDGIRLQIHKYGNEIKLFSRNLEDLTSQFEEIKMFLLDNFNENFIIDCECVAFDYEEKKYLDFQILSRRILSKEKNTNIKVQVKAFDILKLNNENLMNEAFEKRREILENLFLNRDLKQEKL